MMPGLLFLLPIVMLQDPAVDVVVDPALQKKLTVSQKGQPINDVVRELGRAAGVTCAAVQNIWDLKVNVFCKDELAGPVMHQLAQVLGAEWTKEGDVYRLGFERTVQQQRIAYEQAEARLMRERIEKGIAPYLYLAASNPNAPKPKEDMKARVDALSKDPTAVAFGRMLGEMNSSNAAGFWRGDVQTYLPPMAPPPPESSVAFPSEATRVTARFDPFLTSVERHPGRDPLLQTNTLVLYEKPPEALKAMPYARDLLAWASVSSIPSEDERFKKAAQFPVDVRSDFYVPKPVLDDYLESFHKSTGIAVVGDSFSIVQSGRAGGGDARSWVAGLSALKADGKVSHGVVGVRHRGFWRLRKFEIPQTDLASYEQLAKIDPLTLDQYAALAGKLKPIYASALSLPNTVAMKFDPTPFQRMMPALKFYDMLSAPQKREARSGLDATKLSDVQKRAFVDAMLAGVLLSKDEISYLSVVLKGDLSNTGVLVAEESIDSGLKDKKKKAILSGRKFFIHLGKISRPVKFEATVKGAGPIEAEE